MREQFTRATLTKCSMRNLQRSPRLDCLPNGLYLSVGKRNREIHYQAQTYQIIMPRRQSAISNAETCSGTERYAACILSVLETVDDVLPFQAISELHAHVTRPVVLSAQSQDLAKRGDLFLELFRSEISRMSFVQTLL